VPTVFNLRVHVEQALSHARIQASQSSGWDKNKPAPLSSNETAVASAAVTSASAANTTVSSGGTATNSTANTSSLLSIADCQTKGLASLDVDLARDAEHVDASKAGTSEAVLFWRLSSSPLPAAEAAAAEASAEAPLLHLANLGNKLRISMAQGKPFLVLYVRGKELPVSYADVTVPAVHAKDGKRPAAEIQLVHMPSSGMAVAVALQLDEVKEEDGNKFLSSLLQALPSSGEVGDVRGADPMTLHGALGRGVAGRFFRYYGMLEGNSCGAAWHVLEERGRITSQQLEELRKDIQAPDTPTNFRGPTALRADILGKPDHPQAAVEPISPPASPSLKSLLLSLPRQRRQTAMAP